MSESALEQESVDHKAVSYAYAGDECLPESWVYKSLGEVATILAGVGFPKALQGHTGGVYPVFKVGDISAVWKLGQRRLSVSSNNLSEDAAASIRAKVHPENTIVFAKIGEALRLNRRAMLARPAIFDNNVMGVLADREQLDADYLFYYMLTVDLGVLSRATTVPSIRKSDVEQIAIPIAPLEVQRRIVAEIEKQFSRLDEGVASLKRVKANLKRYKAAVLKAAVEGKLTEEWRKQNPDVEPASKLIERILAERRTKWEEAELAKMKAKGKEPKNDKWKEKYKEPLAFQSGEPLAGIPATWSVASVDQIAGEKLIGLVRGKAAQNTKGQGYPYIKMNNVTTAGQVTSEGLVFVEADSDELKRYELKGGDILFNTRNSQELVGKTGLVRDIPANSVFNNNLMRIRVVDGISSEFISEQMCSKPFRDQLERVKRATTNVAAIYGKDLFPLSLAIPPRLEQEEVALETSRLNSLLIAIDSNLQLLQKKSYRLRQSILASAFGANKL